MDLFYKLDSFYKTSNLPKGFYGYSVLKRPLYYFKVYKTEYPKIIVTYCIHAREHITTKLALKQIKDYAKQGKVGTVYFLPMLNPDGVKIALTEKPLYKANANGVDLNVNFDARWGTGEKNVFQKGDENFIGEKPFSEPETAFLLDFTLKVKPDITLSYHCKGEEIYYEFFQPEKDRIRDFEIAKSISNVTGYQIKSTPNSAGGYKDWCIEKLRIPAITIEVGNDNLSHPLTDKHLADVYKKNKTVIKTVTEHSVWKKNLCI